MSLHPDCYYGDHRWRGGSICVLCGKQLRCWCGQFVRADDIDTHLKHSCPWAQRTWDEVNDDIEGSWGVRSP